MRLRSIKGKDKNGFTILEVMVALAIVGISVGIFFSVIGNSSRLREKIDRHSELLLLARTKTEEALLGILKDARQMNDTGKTFEGITKDGAPWRVYEVDKYKEAMDKMDPHSNSTEESSVEIPPEGTTLLSTLVGGISIETIFFAEASHGIHAEEEEEGKVDENTDGNAEEEIEGNREE